jgi:hypothetical protein
MLRCMPATRTQVYLTEDQRRRIDEFSKLEGLTMAEVVRRAVNAYLKDRQIDPASALSATFGVDPEASPPDRGEWDRG